MSQAKRKKSTPATLALALGCGMAFLFVFVVLIVRPWFSAIRVRQRHLQCRENVRRVSLAFKMYANENEGEYPPLSSEPGRLMFDNVVSPIYPDYIDDLAILVCPLDEKDREALRARQEERNPQAFCDDHSYFYLGYALTNDAEVAAFADAYRARIANGGDFSRDLDAPEGFGTGGGNRFLRLGEEPLRLAAAEKLEPELSANPAAYAEWISRIPVIIERPGHHASTPSHVVYLDGHVEYPGYPGKWPMTEQTIEILTSLAD